MLAQQIREHVLARLGFSSAPSLSVEGLHAVYSAWCVKVPFDNVRKMIALRSGANTPLPGATADNFFSAWLRDGAGGTCWPTSNALFELLSSLGFNARRVAGSMRDLGVVNHGSVKVRLENQDWLVDSSMLTNLPLPLTQNVFVSRDPVFPVEVEPTNETHLVWVDMPPTADYLPCRLLMDPATHEEYVARYEQSREHSPFNQRLFARTNTASELIVFFGRSRFVRTANGLERRDLTPEQLCEMLHEDIGLSESLLDRWKQSGGLEASFEPPAGPKPPPITGRPPSRR